MVIRLPLEKEKKEKVWNLLEKKKKSQFTDVWISVFL